MKDQASNRAFGITIGIIVIGASTLFSFIAGTISQTYIWLACIGLALIFMGCFFPLSLTWLNFLWTKFGSIAAKIVNPVVLFGIFISVIVPVGLLMRMLGKRPLNFNIDRSTNTYWEPPNSVVKQNSSMKDQF